MLDSPWFWAGARATPAVGERWSAPRDQPRADRANSDAATLGRAHAIVRDRRHVTERSDLETHRMEREERRFATRPEIGRATRRATEWQEVETSVVAGSIKQKT